MSLRYIWLALVAGCLAACHTPDEASHTVPSPYAGEETRAVKALSPADLAAYRAGEGMGLAKAAELNHYPGPRHVLDLAAELALTPEQTAQTQSIFDAMHAEAVRLGEAVIAAETRLDALFAGRTADEDTVRAAVEEIAALNGALRHTHLAAHLRMMAVLTPEQVRQYVTLRGYADGDPAAHDAHMDHEAHQSH